VKNGVHVHVFNLCGDDFGNPELPAKFHVASVKPIHKRTPMIAATLVFLGLAVGGFWYVLRPRTTPLTQPAKLETVAPVVQEQSLIYWLTVQKMLNHKPLGAPIESAGDISFGNGWKFHFNVRPMQSGALYLISAGPGKDSVEEYNILFPLAKHDQLDPRLAANETMRAGPYDFVEQTGVEKLWIIWTRQPVAELDAIFSEAVRNKKDPGVIANPDQIALLQSYFKKYDAARPEVIPDRSKKLTLVKGRGDIFVSLVELPHEAY
jgi:hypothetical protein